MSDDEIEHPIELGKTGICVPSLGTGAWSWGDRFFWGYGRDYSAEQVQEVFDLSMEAGINFFDTAEIYGNGMSERFLGRFAPGGKTSDGQEVLIATKFYPFPWRLWKSTLIGALKRSLKRLNLERVDLYQVHMPLPPVPVETWAEALGRAVQEGLARAVGVSNYSADRTRRAHDALDKMGIPLASNQVEYSLLNRQVERNGVLEACRERGITVIAYSPLAKGMLTGKYTPDNPPRGFRAAQYRREHMPKIQKLVQLMFEIGRAHDSKTPAQVAINWAMCKGTLPIPGAKNARQAQENLGAAGWRLSMDEVAGLDALSQEVSWL